MTETEQPQIYLVSPAEFELSRFPALLAEVLAAHPVACVRLALSSHDEDKIARAADALREVCHAAEVALVIDTHFLMVERLGLDGVHLPDGPRHVRKAREQLGADAIVGAGCGASRHDGMTAGEAGADYVAFGPVSESALGDGSRAEDSLFDWWSQMIEVPVVAEGGITPARAAELAPICDFLAIGDEIWQSEDPVAALAEIRAALPS